MQLSPYLWRESPYAPLLEYQITRVMYGMTSAAHLATRTMIQCGRDNADRFPKAAEAIEKCFYVDDGLFGGHTIQETKLLCKEVDFVLRTAGMELRDWISNSKEIRHAMENESSQLNIDIGVDAEEAKVLGLRWLTATDEFTIFVKSEGLSRLCTKREVLSGIGRLYDPNGYIAPIIIIAKILMQDIWRQKEIGWDNELPTGIVNRWQELVKEIVQLPAFRIPRWIRTGNAQVQLHGFCDASSQAYGAVLYARVVDSKGKISTSLLCAKSRVAPRGWTPIRHYEYYRNISNIRDIRNEKINLYYRHSVQYTSFMHLLSKCCELSSSEFVLARILGILAFSVINI